MFRPCSGHICDFYHSIWPPQAEPIVRLPTVPLAPLVVVDCKSIVSCDDIKWHLRAVPVCWSTENLDDLVWIPNLLKATLEFHRTDCKCFRYAHREDPCHTVSDRREVPHLIRSDGHRKLLECLWYFSPAFVRSALHQTLCEARLLKLYNPLYIAYSETFLGKHCSDNEHYELV